MGMEGSPNLCSGGPEWGKGALEVGCGMLDAFFQTNMVPNPPSLQGSPSSLADCPTSNAS